MFWYVGVLLLNFLMLGLFCIGENIGCYFGSNDLMEKIWLRYYFVGVLVEINVDLYLLLVELMDWVFRIFL